MSASEGDPDARTVGTSGVVAVKVYLVYQAGIANVFSVEKATLDPEGRKAMRLLQGDFRACENFARGMAAAGCEVRTAGCNMAGDIANQPWTADLDSLPFSEEFRPIMIAYQDPEPAERQAASADAARQATRMGAVATGRDASGHFARFGDYGYARDFADWLDARGEPSLLARENRPWSWAVRY